MNLDIKEKLLSPNKYSRPGRSDEYDHVRKGTNSVVLHWTANPQQTASGVWNWFNDKKNGKTGYGSAHFIVDFDGSIIQCIPEDELAYHVGSKTYTEFGQKISSYPNDSTIGIEMCVINSEGEYTEATWESAVILSALLLQEYGLTDPISGDLSTHHDIVGWKNCPKWFVDYPDELKRFRKEVAAVLKYGLFGTTNKSTSVLYVKKENNLVFTATYNIESRIRLTGIYHGMIRIQIPETGVSGYTDAKHINILYDTGEERGYVG